jgi:short subunit dehydrogenase-like uncharacterized protein
MREQLRYDVALLGATGFTGRLAAEYMATAMAGRQDRWAIAGRSRGKLEALRAELTAIDAECDQVGIVEADVGDLVSLLDLADGSRVVISTVGPYARYGEPVVQACVRQRADYVDITGEPAFVKLVASRYGRDAARQGVRVVSCCGFDSIPPDLGVFTAVEQLPGQPLKVEGFVSMNGVFSGGTWQTALEAIGDGSLGDVTGGPGEGDASQGSRRVRAARPSIRHVDAIHGWAVPMPTVDPLIVLRSARTIPEYGPDFSYAHSLRVGSLAKVVALTGGVGVGAGLARLGPTRSLLSRLKPAGTGPTPEQREGGSFRVTVLAEGTDDRVRVEVRGGDPGYSETSKMISESALCLADDREQLPDRTGVLTPAAAMGDPLRERLRTAGMTIEVTQER